MLLAKQKELNRKIHIPTTAFKRNQANMYSPRAELQRLDKRGSPIRKSDAKAREREERKNKIIKKFSGKDESGKRKRIKSKKGNNPNRIWKRHGRQR